MREALFKCTGTGKVLYCSDTEYGAGFPPKGLTVSETITWLKSNSKIRTFKMVPDYFDKFVKVHSRRLTRLK